MHLKAAALLHSLTRNHPLVDGNKRLGLAATLAFLGVDGLRLTLDNDDAYALVMAVATGELDDVTAIRRTRRGHDATARRWSAANLVTVVPADLLRRPPVACTLGGRVLTRD